MPRIRIIAAWGAAFAVLALLFVFDERLQPSLVSFADRERTGEPNPQVGAVMDLLRILGKWPVLALSATLLLLFHPGGRRWAAVTVLSSATAIVATELVWRSVSRVRPSHPMHAGRTVFLKPFRGFTGDREGASFPSSEGAASMALAAALAAALPQATVLWYALAAGCSLMRVEAGAHFPSDVWAGAMLGYACARLCIRLFGGSAECAVTGAPKPSGSV